MPNCPFHGKSGWNLTSRFKQIPYGIRFSQIIHLRRRSVITDRIDLFWLNTISIQQSTQQLGEITTGLVNRRHAGRIAGDQSINPLSKRNCSAAIAVNGTGDALARASSLTESRSFSIV